jgi:Lipoprotein LpqB beta-propeller domain/Sporulation and spore germination
MITSRAGRLASAGLAWWPRAGTRGRAAAAAFAVAVAVAVGGCSTVPTSGPVQQVGAGQLGISQDYSQPIPVGPGPDWTATEIVSGFLAASASFANDHQVAREYLDAQAQRKWQPGWAVTVVSKPPTTSTAPPSLRQPLAGPQQARVKVTGLPVATLTDTGQYLVSSASSSQSYYYNLTKVDGQWRIDTLPRTQLLLTQADFQRVYQPRDLYFLTPSGKTLVPDPVFVPQQATNTELATGLVTALLTDRDKGWLSGAVLSGFPANAQLIDDPVTINGSNVIVDLAEKHAVSDRRQLNQMAAQLAWTLGNGPTTAIQSVELEINGHPVQIMGGQSALPQDFADWVPAQPDGSSFYFIGSHGSVEELSGVGQPGSGRVAVVPGAAGTTGVPPFSSIAVSPGRRWVAGISAGGGAVYFGSLSPGARLIKWQPTSGSCTSVSWDDLGDLWIAAGGQVWMLPPGSTSAQLATLDGVPPQDEVTQFRVAPDGVRAAMIVRGTFDNQPGGEVQLAAITRTGGSVSVGPPVTIGSAIPDPEAVSWFGTDDVIILSGSSSGAQLHEVPLNGAQPAAIAVTGGVPVSLTATSPGGSTAEIVLGMSDGKIMISASLGTFEPARTLGAAPVFPG